VPAPAVAAPALPAPAVPAPAATATETTSTPLIYIFPPALKEMLREIGNQCYTYFGLPNLFGHIKFKYYDHQYKDCRLLAMERTSGRKKIELPPLFMNHMLDFLCVAAHYATRYGSADHFLQQSNETKLVDYAFFLKRNTPETIVTTFIEKSLTACAAGSSSIDFKNMIFLWKKFLNEGGIPTIIFHETLKNFLKLKFAYDDKKEFFIGVTSLHLPVVLQFIKFWDDNIVDDEEDTELMSSSSELEIGEIALLFKQWLVSTKSNIGKHSLTEILMVELLQHFYPEVAIKAHKYVLRVKCKFWDKRAEVLTALKAYQNQHTVDKPLEEEEEGVLYEAYAFYCATQKNKGDVLVSKAYFEKISVDFILENLEIQFP